MLTILVKSIVSANTNTNTAFEKYCQYQYFCDSTFTVYFIQQHSFFPQTSINKFSCRENGKITIVNSGMMLTSKHCSGIYFRCKTTVLAFTLSGTVMLLLTDLISAPDDKSIGIEYCQKNK